MSTLKKVLLVHEKPAKHWVGDAFEVRSMFSYTSRSMGNAISPFLLLDYGEPNTFAPREEERGVGEHPHRGFETVTIAYQGEVEHRDSGGHSGKIGPGDVQWMTAASGVVHEEKLSSTFQKNGGTIEMAQLWVNLPAKFKMSKPRYQAITKDQIQTVQLPNGAGTVRVIAGEFGGAKGPAQTYTPLNVLDTHLNAGANLTLDVPEGRNVILAVLRGALKINGTSIAIGGQAVLLDRDGDSVSLEATEDTTMLILNGEAIPEPVVGYGPFVMNTREEIMQAINDYQDGKMGHLN
jgi:hypothetical protein